MAQQLKLSIITKIKHSELWTGVVLLFFKLFSLDVIIENILRHKHSSNLSTRSMFATAKNYINNINKFAKMEHLFEDKNKFIRIFRIATVDEKCVEFSLATANKAKIYKGYNKKTIALNIQKSVDINQHGNGKCIMII